MAGSRQYDLFGLFGQVIGLVHLLQLVEFFFLVRQPFAGLPHVLGEVLDRVGTLGLAEPRRRFSAASLAALRAAAIDLGTDSCSSSSRLPLVAMPTAMRRSPLPDRQSPDGSYAYPRPAVLRLFGTSTVLDGPLNGQFRPRLWANEDFGNVRGIELTIQGNIDLEWLGFDREGLAGLLLLLGRLWLLSGIGVRGLFGGPGDGRAGETNPAGSDQHSWCTSHGLAPGAISVSGLSLHCNCCVAAGTLFRSFRR